MQRLKKKPIVIAARRKELNHFMGQTYGKFETLPLVSAGWYHRKSHGDFFTINSFQSMGATNFTKQNTEAKVRDPVFSDYALDPGIVSALAKCGFKKPTN